MGKVIRLFLIIAVLAMVVAVVGQRTILASPPPPIDVPGDPDTGSGTYELGGCVTGSVNGLTQGFKLHLELLDDWNSFPIDGLPGLPASYWDLPGGPGDIFTCLVDVTVMENDAMHKNLPSENGTAEVCLETPIDKAGSIYYFDVNKLISDTPTWVKVGGPFEGGAKACVPVTNSGIYSYFAPMNIIPVTGAYPLTFFRITTDGSVDVPEFYTVIVEPGPLAVGGCVTGNVKDLAQGKGYRMVASVIKSTDVKELPEDVGEFYECVLDLKLYQGDTLINELPEEDGVVTICFAIPPDQNGSVYALDKYFDDGADWTQVAGAFESGIACSPIMKTGIYGMVDVQP